MGLLTASLRRLLSANAERGARDLASDPLPQVKLFNPVGAATWLASELFADGDTLYGLVDLGFGSPELGCFSLYEIESVLLPLGLGIERDRVFFTRHRLSVWTATARRTGSIRDAEIILARSAFEGRWEAPLPPLPLPPGRRGGG